MRAASHLHEQSKSPVSPLESAQVEEGGVDSGEKGFVHSRNPEATSITVRSEYFSFF